MLAARNASQKMGPIDSIETHTSYNSKQHGSVRHHATPMRRAASKSSRVMCASLCLRREMGADTTQRELRRDVGKGHRQVGWRQRLGLAVRRVDRGDSGIPHRR